MKTSHLSMLSYDFEFLGHTEADNGILNYKPTHIISDNKVAIAISIVATREHQELGT